MPAPFDVAIAVDWSARSSPASGRDSIWLAIDDGAGPATENPSTRRAAEERLGELLDEKLLRRARVVLGIDVSLGCPDGTAAAIGLPTSGEPPWRSVWTTLEAAIDDDDRNRNNRFDVAAEFNARIRARTGRAGPFWGCPPSKAGPDLAATKPRGPVALDEWRFVERSLREIGRRPFSCWQLLGAGAVGSQTLLAIPVFERLRRRHPERMRIWPFEPSDTQPGTITVVEMWPSLLQDVDVELASAEQAAVAMVRDEAQVRAAATWLRGVGTLRCPEGVDTEEGWIAGVVPGRRAP